MYSLISNLTSSMPSILARLLAISVLPTPVGPANKNEPIGLSSSLSPDLDSRITLHTDSTASSWPKTLPLAGIQVFRVYLYLMNLSFVVVFLPF